MYNLDITEHAEYDLEKIIKYISENLSAPQAAYDFADLVYECYERIEQNPYIYEESWDPKLKKEGFRRAVIKNYIMLYKVYEDKKPKMVIVHRFFHGSQNYFDLL